MKKFLLSIATILVGLCVAENAWAQDAKQMLFGYCSNNVNGIGNGYEKYYIGGAMKITKENAELFKGNKLTGVVVGFGQAKTTYATLFISHDLKEEPFYEQILTDLAPRTWTEKTLDTPFDLDGEEFYIGYYVYTQDGEYPIGFDGDKADVQPYMGYLGSSPTTPEGMRTDFESWSHRYGRLCLKLKIEGDNLPQNMGDLSQLVIPVATELDTPFGGEMTLTNQGANTIESIEAIVTVADAEPMVIEKTNLGVECGKSAKVLLEGLKISTPGYAQNVKVELSKINGVAVGNQSVLNAWIMAGNDLPMRTVVVEEGTGTWCQYCPRGYWGMEEMQKKYGDTDTYIGIAVHSGDEMSLPAYNGFLNAYFEGLPSAMINRKILVDPSPNTLEQAYFDLLHPVEASVKISGYIDDPARKSMDATVEAQFSFDFEDADYAIAVVVTEDNVGPYLQTNGYSGGRFGPCGGFEFMQAKVELMYNEVPRYVNQWNGAIASVPGTLKAGETYSFKQKVSLKNVTNLENTNLIGMLINRSKDGEIINAARIPFSAVVDGVESMFGTDVKVAAGNGQINVSGEFSNAQVYDCEGRLAGVLTEEGSLSAANGIYFVRVSAQNMTKTFKVIL